MAKQSNLWTWQGLKHGNKSTGPLYAEYEVNYSPMSDNHDPETTSAEELLGLWLKEVQGKCPDGLVSIYWGVASSPELKFGEALPFQHDPPMQDFLKHYSWPVHAETGEPLNWISLPVQDLHWKKGRADKGGFIQEATGWKPSILQPSVRYAMFRDARR